MPHRRARGPPTVPLAGGRVRFNSLAYIAFLAIVLVVHFRLLTTARAQNVFVTLASYVFYAWWDWRFCSLMLLSSAVDFGVGRALDGSTDPGRRRRLLASSVVVNLGLLFTFKYFGFFLDNLDHLLTALGFAADRRTLAIVLPVGISFYTFQTLGYTIDVYRRRIPACREPETFLAFVSFFPQLVAGPIERAGSLIPQFARLRVFDHARAVDGCRLILWGLVKKMVLADNLGLLVDPVYRSPGEFSGPALLAATVLFAFQIYYDFSGYSDIAIGSARLLGVDLMRNFALPYFSRSVSELWRRWHISLATWFRDYVYIPLGGSRGGRLAALRNLMVTFVASGLWHGASWNFVIWGGIHGVAVAYETLVRPRSTRLGPDDVPGTAAPAPVWRVASGMLTTFLIFCAALVFFRASSLGDAGLILGRVANGVWAPESWPGALARAFADARTAATIACLTVMLLIEWSTRPVEHPLALVRSRGARWCTYTGLVWLIMVLGAPVTGPFIYFQF